MEDGELLQAKRRMAMDILDHDELLNPDYQKRLGMAPASRDVTDREFQDSDDRLEMVGHLKDPVFTLSGVAATALPKTMLELLAAAEEDTQRDVLGAALATVSFAIVANLVDLGHLAITHPEDSHV